MGKETMPDLVRRAPKLREEDIRAINGTFRSFLFRCRRTGELWTSCCGRHERLKERDVTGAEQSVMKAEHSREIRSSWDNFKPKKTVCPYCGREAEVKELGRSGVRKNLREWGRGIVLRWSRGYLWAIVYNAKKVYLQDNALTAQPMVYVDGAYRFCPGEKPKVEWVFREWWYHEWGDEWDDEWDYTKKGACTDGWKINKIKNPFHNCDKYGDGYDVINVGEWEKSPFCWCEMGPWDTVQYIAACTFWPRQVEMLEKAGLKELVDDLVDRGTKNAYIFSWDEPDPRKSFGLNGGELKEFLTMKCRSKDLLTYHKKLNKAGLRVGFDETRMLELMCGGWAEKVVTRLARYKLPPARWEKYIEREQGDRSRAFVAEQWVDYADKIRAISSGGGGAATDGPLDPVEFYRATRPGDWLPMPEPGEDEIYLLVHILGHGSLLAFTVSCQGEYTVALGTVKEGGFVERSSVTLAGGSKYETELMADDFGDLTASGRKQAMVKVSGNGILGWEKSAHSKWGEDESIQSFPIVEFRGKLPLAERVYAGFLQSLRYFSLEGPNNIVDASAMLAYDQTLEAVLELDTSKVEIGSGMCECCYQLKAVPELDVGRVTTADMMFSLCFSLRYLPPLHFTSATELGMAFSSSGLEACPVKTSPRLTRASTGQIFELCASLREVSRFDISGFEGLYLDGAFVGCCSLEKLTFDRGENREPVKGGSVDLTGCALGHAAILELIESLPIGIKNGNYGCYLILIGNPGAAELTEEEKAVATGKGWTVR